MELKIQKMKLEVRFNPAENSIFGQNSFFVKTFPVARII